MDGQKTTPVTRRKMEIVEIQMRQVRSMKAKIQFIEAMEEKARTTQIEFLNQENNDAYTLWRGDRIEHYLFGNLLNDHSEVRKDMEKVQMITGGNE